MIGVEGRYLFQVSPQIIIVIIVLEILSAISSGLFGRWSLTLNRAVRRRIGRLFGFSFDSFTHILTIITNSMERRHFNDYKKFSFDWYLKALYLAIATTTFKGYLKFVNRCTLVIFLYLAGNLVFEGHIKIGQIAAILIYLEWMRAAFESFNSSFATIMTGLGSIERIMQLHDKMAPIPSEAEEKKQKKRLSTLDLSEKGSVLIDTDKLTINGIVHVEDIWYKHLGGSDVLNGVNIDLVPGRITGIFIIFLRNFFFF